MRLDYVFFERVLKDVGGNFCGYYRPKSQRMAYLDYRRIFLDGIRDLRRRDFLSRFYAHVRNFLRAFPDCALFDEKEQRKIFLDYLVYLSVLILGEIKE